MEARLLALSGVLAHGPPVKSCVDIHFHPLGVECLGPMVGTGLSIFSCFFQGKMGLYLFVLKLINQPVRLGLLLSWCGKIQNIFPQILE